MKLVAVHRDIHDICRSVSFGVRPLTFQVLPLYWKVRFRHEVINTSYSTVHARDYWLGPFRVTCLTSKVKEDSPCRSEP